MLGARPPFVTGRLGTMAEGYCVKDKKKVVIQNAEKITMKNGKPATQGICPDCGGKVFRIGGWTAKSSIPIAPPAPAGVAIFLGQRRLPRNALCALRHARRRYGVT